MKRYMLGAVITLAGLSALAAGASAESSDVVVHIKQGFVAGRNELPPGTYRISQDPSGAGQVLFLRGDEAGASLFLLPTTHGASSPGQLHVKLTRVGDVYYLSEVATEIGVYTLAPPQRASHGPARSLARMSSAGSD